MLLEADIELMAGVYRVVFQVYADKVYSTSSDSCSFTHLPGCVLVGVLGGWAGWSGTCIMGVA